MNCVKGEYLCRKTEENHYAETLYIAQLARQTPCSDKSDICENLIFGVKIGTNIAAHASDPQTDTNTKTNLHVSKPDHKTFSKSSNYQKRHMKEGKFWLWPQIVPVRPHKTEHSLRTCWLELAR